MSIFSLCLPPSPPPPPGTRFCQQIVWIPSALAALTGGREVGGGSEATRNLRIPTVLSFSQVLSSPPRSEGPLAMSSVAGVGGPPAQTSALLCPFCTVLANPSLHPAGVESARAGKEPGPCSSPRPACCAMSRSAAQPPALATPQAQPAGWGAWAQAGVLLVCNWLAASVRARTLNRV